VREPVENPHRIHSALQDVMQDDAGIARSEQSLQRALAEIAGLRDRAQRVAVGGDLVFNPGWHACRDLEVMLTVSEAIVRSALQRRESRGAHWRLDFPEQSEEEGGRRYIVCRRGKEMVVDTLAREELPPDGEQRLRRSRFFADRRGKAAT
jgi:succinate dehydrogenase / fumarate reductase flavoprotein subunit